MFGDSVGNAPQTGAVQGATTSSTAESVRPGPRRHGPAPSRPGVGATVVRMENRPARRQAEFMILRSAIDAGRNLLRSLSTAPSNMFEWLSPCGPMPDTWHTSNQILTMPRLRRTQRNRWPEGGSPA